MYSVVLMAALTAGAETPTTWGHRHGCHGYVASGCSGCYGACYGACYGCYGASYGGYRVVGAGGCHGAFSCYGGTYSTACYGSCHGGYYNPFGCHGCYGCYGCQGYAPMAGPSPAIIYPAVPPGAAPGAPPAVKPKEPVPAPKGETGALPAKATLIVELPADANLYIDDRLMKSPSDKRTFSTPVLEPGQAFYYLVRAEMVRDGKTMTETKRVIVRAGEEVHASFADKEGVTAVRAGK